MDRLRPLSTGVSDLLNTSSCKAMSKKMLAYKNPDHPTLILNDAIQEASRKKQMVSDGDRESRNGLYYRQIGGGFVVFFFAIYFTYFPVNTEEQTYGTIAGIYSTVMWLSICLPFLPVIELFARIGSLTGKPIFIGFSMLDRRLSGIGFLFSFYLFLETVRWLIQLGFQLTYMSGFNKVSNHVAHQTKDRMGWIGPQWPASTHFPICSIYTQAECETYDYNWDTLQRMACSWDNILGQCVTDKNRLNDLSQRYLFCSGRNDPTISSSMGWNDERGWDYPDYWEETLTGWIPGDSQDGKKSIWERCAMSGDVVIMTMIGFAILLGLGLRSHTRNMAIVTLLFIFGFAMATYEFRPFTRAANGATHMALTKKTFGLDYMPFEASASGTGMLYILTMTPYFVKATATSLSIIAVLVYELSKSRWPRQFQGNVRFILVPFVIYAVLFKCFPWSVADQIKFPEAFGGGHYLGQVMHQIYRVPDHLGALFEERKYPSVESLSMDPLILFWTQINAAMPPSPGKLPLQNIFGEGYHEFYMNLGRSAGLLCVSLFTVTCIALQFRYAFRDDFSFSKKLREKRARAKERLTKKNDEADRSLRSQSFNSESFQFQKSGVAPNQTRSAHSLLGQSRSIIGGKGTHASQMLTMSSGGEKGVGRSAKAEMVRSQLDGTAIDDLGAGMTEPKYYLEDLPPVAETDEDQIRMDDNLHSLIHIGICVCLLLCTIPILTYTQSEVKDMNHRSAIRDFDMDYFRVISEARSGVLFLLTVFLWFISFKRISDYRHGEPANKWERYVGTALSVVQLSANVALGIYQGRDRGSIGDTGRFHYDIRSSLLQMDPGAIVERHVSERISVLFGGNLCFFGLAVIIEGTTALLRKYDKITNRGFYGTMPGLELLDMYERAIGGKLGQTRTMRFNHLRNIVIKYFSMPVLVYYSVITLMTQVNAMLTEEWPITATSYLLNPYQLTVKRIMDCAPFFFLFVAFLPMVVPTVIANKWLIKNINDIGKMKGHLMVESTIPIEVSFYENEKYLSEGSLDKPGTTSLEDLATRVIAEKENSRDLAATSFEAKRATELKNQQYYFKFFSKKPLSQEYLKKQAETEGRAVERKREELVKAHDEDGKEHEAAVEI